MMKPFDRDQFIGDMRELARMDVRFRHQGNDPATGMDCVNAPRYGYQKQGLFLPEELNQEFESYSESPDGWNLLAIMRKWFEEVPLDAAQPGDLLVLYARRNPKHVAVKVTNSLIVEAYRSEDRSIEKIIEQPLDPRRRVAAVFRIPDFAPQA